MIARAVELVRMNINGVFIITGFCLMLAANLSGHLSYDSFVQLLHRRTVVYNTWYPPVIAWLLGLGDALVPGIALFIVLAATVALNTRGAGED